MNTEKLKTNLKYKDEKSFVKNLIPKKWDNEKKNKFI